MDRKKNLKTGLIRWGVILVLLVVVFIWKRSLIEDAGHALKQIPWWVNGLMFAAGMIYFLFEGGIMHRLTTVDADGKKDSGDHPDTERKSISLWRGVCCAFYCEFYRMVTVGAATAVAQIFYYHCFGIKTARAGGLCLIQYTLQKAMICIMGLIAFGALYLSGHGGTLAYGGWVALGLGVTVLIVTFLVIISVSEKFSRLIIRILERILRKKPEKLQGVRENVMNFNREGRIIYRDKKNVALILLMNFAKLVFWYMIPAILYLYTDGANLLTVILLMAMINMLSGVMLAPAGVGTLEFLFSSFFGPMFGKTMAALGVILYRLYIWFVPFLFGAVAAAFRTKAEEKTEENDGSGSRMQEGRLEK